MLNVVLDVGGSKGKINCGIIKQSTEVISKEQQVMGGTEFYKSGRGVWTLSRG